METNNNTTVLDNAIIEGDEITITVGLQYKFTKDDIEDLLSAGLTGSEWFMVDNTTDDYKETKASMDDPYLEQILAQMLVDGKGITICSDEEEDGSFSTEHHVTLEDMLYGISETIKAGWNGDVYDADYCVADEILQYAIYKELIWG